jgi:hypothetical protein
MKKLCLAIAALALVSTTSGGSHAQQVGDVSTAGGQRSQSFNFDDELVSGQLVRPDGDSTRVRRRNSVNSLIRIREHFVPEMLKSVENL